LFHEIPNNSVDVVAQIGGEHFVLAQLAAESTVQARLPPRCTWKPSTGPSPVVDHRPFEPDVGDLDAAHELGQPLMLTVIGTRAAR